MGKRLKLGLLALVGILLLVLGVFLFLSPYLAERRATQPPRLPTTIQSSQPQETPNAIQQPLAPIETSPAPTEGRLKLRLLENQARNVVERIGSGTSADGFLGYLDVLVSLTESAKTSLLSEQKALRQQYPPNGPLMGFSTVTVSSEIGAGSYGDEKLVATVQAIHKRDGGDPSRPTATATKRATITFLKQPNGSYLIDRIEWKEGEG